MDRHHEPDRAACRLRPRRAQDPRGEAGRRHLSHLRHQDLHHLRRPRDDRQHHPSRAGAPARCAARHARHLAVPGAQVSRQRGRLARRPQRRGLRRRRAQARHPREPDLRHEVRREGRRRRLSGRRGEPRPQRHVHHDERGAPRGRHAGRGGGRARHAARLAYAKERRQGRTRQSKGRRAWRRSSSTPTSAAP